MECANCGKSYPATYFRRHRCKGQPILRKDFPCTICDVVCTFKSNIIRHYKEQHSLEKEEIPLSVIRIKREKKPRKPCPTCGKALTQLSNHKCKGENLIAPQPMEESASSSSESDVSSDSASADEDDNDDDDDVDDAGSDISHDSIAKPKSPPKKVVKKLGKSLPPRTATWRSPSDIPTSIKEHIRKVYSKLQFSKIMDHQVRMRLADGSFDFRIYQNLVINSVGRDGVDAINLIKLVYDEQRARPRYMSPAK